MKSLCVEYSPHAWISSDLKTSNGIKYLHLWILIWRILYLREALLVEILQYFCNLLYEIPM
jgi:hypothetical protein